MSNPKRRDDGEGSVYPLKDGRWQAAVTIGWVERPDGSRRRRYKTADAPTKAQAKEKLKDLLKARDAGRLPVGAAVTVEQWMRYWLEFVAPRRCVTKTLEGYETQVRHWIIPTIGRIKLLDLAPEHIEHMHDVMYRGKERTRSNGRTVAARPLSSTSVLQAHRVLSRALKVAEQRGKIARNPAELVDPPKIGAADRAVRYLSVADSRKVLMTCAGRWNDALWSVGLALGLRPGERLGLLWDQDVDLTDATLTVQRQLQRRRATAAQKGRLELVPYTKSAAGRRTIAVPAELLTVLKAHRRRQLERRLAIGDEWTQSELGDLVFTTETGGAIDPRRDWEAWRRLLTEADAPYVSPHGSRHTAASLMLLQGVDVKVVQTILGHGSSTITRDLYQHVAPELARQAADAVGGALWGDSNVSHGISHDR